MANVLPAPSMKKHLSAQVARMLVTAAAMMFLLAVILILAALPAYIQLHAEYTTDKEYIAALDTAQAGAEREERNTLIFTQRRLQVFTALFNSTPLSETVALITEKIPPELSITALTYGEKDGVGTLSLLGKTTSRAAVQAYLDVVQGVPGVTQARIPIQSLARGETGNADIQITLQR